MEKSKEALEKLKVAVKGGREYSEKLGTLPLEYVTENVFSALQNVLKYLIEERHKVDKSESEEDNFVIHYTSIAALESMLQNASKGDKKSSLRLYDSVHLNDPDEGNYFARNFNLPKKYDWLGKKDVSHAYIVSFILPNSEEDMSNNLVFWRIYGKEGEGCSLLLRVPRCRLQKVLYGTKKVKRTVKDLRSVLDLLEPFSNFRLGFCWGQKAVKISVRYF